MKKYILLSLICSLSMAVYSQNGGNKSIYMYRNDGMINTFLPEEIDSIEYSFYDLENILHEDVVTQIIYTADSVYTLPISIVDSISFITPDTKYHEGVIVINDEMESYIMSVDNLTIYFSPTTPEGILPSKGDKLVEITQSEKFPFGFMGEVTSVQYLIDSIAVNCDALGYEDIFEYFYYVSEKEIPVQSNPTVKRDLSIYSSEYTEHKLGTYTVPMFELIRSDLKPHVKVGAITGSSTCKIDITPTLWTKGSIIVNPLKGVIVTVDVRIKTEIEETISLYGTIATGKEWAAPEVVVPFSIPGVGIYGCAGAFVKAQADVTMSNYWKQELKSKLHFEYKYQPILALTSTKANLSDVKLENVARNHNGLISGSISAGLFAEVGVEILNRKFASVAIRGEAGLKLSSNYVIKSEELSDAMQSTNLYDRLKNATLTVDGFLNYKAQGKALHIEGSIPITPCNSTFPILQAQLVPLFNNTRLSRLQDNTTLLAQTKAYGTTFFPVNLGFKLFESDKKSGWNGMLNYGYLESSKDLSDNFYGTSKDETYMVYPTVDFLDIKMLASPGAKLKSEEEDDNLCLQSPTENVVFFRNTSGWSNVYCYVWDNGGTEYLGSWPGASAISVGNGYYKVQMSGNIPSGSGIIWSTGGTQCDGHVDPQTVDLVYQNRSLYEVDGHAPNPNYGTLCSTTSEYLPTCTITPIVKICGE